MPPLIGVNCARLANPATLARALDLGLAAVVDLPGPHARSVGVVGDVLRSRPGDAPRLVAKVARTAEALGRPVDVALLHNPEEVGDGARRGDAVAAAAAAIHAAGAARAVGVSSNDVAWLATLEDLAVARVPAHALDAPAARAAQAALARAELVSDLNGSLPKFEAFEQWELEITTQLVPMLHAKFEELDEDSADLLMAFFAAYGAALLEREVAAPTFPNVDAAVLAQLAAALEAAAAVGAKAAAFLPGGDPRRGGLEKPRGAASCRPWRSPGRRRRRPLRRGRREPLAAGGGGRRRESARLSLLAYEETMGTCGRRGRRRRSGARSGPCPRGARRRRPRSRRAAAPAHSPPRRSGRTAPLLGPPGDDDAEETKKEDRAPPPQKSAEEPRPAARVAPAPAVRVSQQHVLEAVRGDAAGLPKQEAGIRNTNLAGDMQALLAERAAVSWGERLRRFLGAQLALWIPLCNLYVTCMLPVYLCFAVERSLALDAIDVASELFAVLELGLQRSRRLRVALSVEDPDPAPTSAAEAHRRPPKDRDRRRPREPAWSVALDVVRGLQLLKFLKLLVIWREAMGATQGPGLVHFDSILFRIARLVSVFFFVLHYLACTYHYIGRKSRHRNGDETWKYYARNGSDRGVAFRWVQSFYAVLAVGLGNNLSPTNTLQALHSSVTLLVGISMTSIGIGAITSLLANKDVVQARRRMKLKQIESYLSKHEVPDELSRTIGEYYEYIWASQMQLDGELFADLTEVLKLKLALAIKRRFIMECPLFKELDAWAIINLVRKLAHEVFVPDQVVMAEGELGDAMYSNEPRSATVVADTFCELFVLHTADFQEGRDFAQLQQSIEAEAHRRAIHRECAKKLRRCKWKILAIMYFIRRYQAAQRAKDGPNNGKLKSRAQAIIHASRLKQLTAAVSSAANSVVRGSTQGAHGDGAPKPGGLGLQRSKVQTNFGPLPPPDDDDDDDDDGGGGGEAPKS
ncbi:voltage-gated potassium channel [Aureococcus anophagefferens]|nr:voltage-gated potassium channel [Aureococcus anophagefferens]